MTRPKLGLAGHKVDPRNRTLKLKAFVAPEIAYPAKCDPDLGLPVDADPLGNLEVGCCGIAAPGHLVRWADSFCSRPWSVDKVAVLNEYENFGYVPGDDSTDNGVYGLDVCKRWRKDGLFGLPPIDAFAQVDFFDDDQMALANFALGGTLLCMSLPNRCAAGDPRDTDTWAVHPDGGNGVLGGHMVLSRGDVINSWGRRILVTPEFRRLYTFDAFAVVWRTALRDGRAFSALDIDGLLAAVKAVTA